MASQAPATIEDDIHAAPRAAHCSFAPPAVALERFREQLAAHRSTKGTLQLPYAAPLPEELLRRMAAYSLAHVRARTDDAFW